MASLLGVDRDQENVTPIHDESINIATSIEEESLIEEEFLTIETIIDSEEVPVKNESVSLVLDVHSEESSLLTFDDEEKTILQASTTFNKTNDWTPMITNSSNVHIERLLLMPFYMPDQYFTHTVPCLVDETSLSFVIVKDDVGTSFDVSAENKLDQPDSKEVLPAVGHDTLEPSSIVCIILTSITAVFFASIIIWLSAVHCWALLVGIISCLKSTTCVGRASLTTRYIVDTLMYKRAIFLMMTFISFLRCGMNTTTNLIRILLLPIDSLFNIPRWVCCVYGPSSYGRSVFDIMFNSNPKQGPKRCKVASTLSDIFQCLLDTGQASLLKLIRLPFALARLVQVLAIIPCVLCLSVAVSIYEDMIGMIRLIRVSIVKFHVIIIYSAIVLPFIEATRDCLYHIQASIFGMARWIQALVVISYAVVHSVAVSISYDIRAYLLFIQASILGLARRYHVMVAISYVIILSVVESIFKAARGYIRISIFGAARLIQVPITISCTLVQSAVATISKTIGNFLYHVQSSLGGMARWIRALIVISCALAYSVVETISKAVRGCIHSTQTFIFGMARRIQVSIIISYVLARSVAVSLSNDVRGCLYHILSPLFGILLVPHWYWKEFGPYSQGRSVFDILFKSNPHQRRRLKRGGQVASRRLNNIHTYTSSDQYPPWHLYRQFDPVIYSTIHGARSCIAMVNELLWAYWLYIRVLFAAVYFQDYLRGYSWLYTFYPGFILRCGSLDSSLHYIISYVRSLHQLERRWKLSVSTSTPDHL